MADFRIFFTFNVNCLCQSIPFNYLSSTIALFEDTGTCLSSSIWISDIILVDVYNCVNNHHHSNSDRTAYSYWALSVWQALF